MAWPRPGAAPAARRQPSPRAQRPERSPRLQLLGNRALAGSECARFPTINSSLYRQLYIASQNYVAAFALYTRICHIWMARSSWMLKPHPRSLRPAVATGAASVPASVACASVLMIHSARAHERARISLSCASTQRTVSRTRRTRPTREIDGLCVRAPDGSAPLV